MKNPDPSFNLHPTTRIFDSVYLESPFRTYAGCVLREFIGSAFSYLADGVSLPGARIGRYSSIGDAVTILSQHPTSTLTTSPISYQAIFPPPFDAQPIVTFATVERTTIGNDVWIGSRVMIKTGIKIGDGAIIGAGSVVTHDVPAFAIVGGAPAKLIRMRFSEDVIARIQKLQWWNYNIVGLPLDFETPMTALDDIEERINDGRLQPYSRDFYRVLIKDKQYFLQPLSKEQQSALLETN